MKKVTLLLGIATFLFVYACKKAQVSPSQEGTVYLDLPATPYEYQLNGTTGNLNFNNVATLGRVLFYDRQLSINNSVACASCHRQELAFADNQAFSRGFENRLTGRNSPAIQNLGLAMNSPIGFGMAIPLFWDGRETSLRSLIMRPVTNHVEMGITDVQGMVTKLAGLPYYSELFRNAYGDDAVTSERVSEAITTFISSITAINTRLDLFNQGKTSLTALELEGRQLFQTKYECTNCHSESFGGYGMSSGISFADIGLNASYTDKGMGAVTGLSSDNGRFRVPNLRNVALTAPYMHDGRFKTLDEVLEHYSHGINNSSNLDVRLKDGKNQPLRMNISVQEKQALIAFLNTLTDPGMLVDPKFSNPFKVK